MILKKKLKIQLDLKFFFKIFLILQETFEIHELS